MTAIQKIEPARDEKFTVDFDDGIRYLDIETRLREKTAGGIVVYERDNEKFCHYIAYANMRELANDHKLQIERSYHSLAAIKLRALSKVSNLDDLEPEKRRDVTFKFHMATTYSAMLAALPSDLPDRCQVARAKAHSHIVGRIIAGEIDCDIARAAEPTPLSTVKSWVDRLHAYDQNPRCLVNRRSGNTSGRFEREVEAKLQVAVIAYLALNRPTLKAVWEDLKDAIVDLNIPRRKAGLEDFPIPSIKTLGRRIAKLERWVVECARHGLAKTEKKYRAVYGGLPALRPGQRVEVDGWTVDLFTLLGETDAWMDLPAEARQKLKSVRLTVIVAIDSATRMIVGIKFSWSENGEAIRGCLRMSMEDKTAIAKAYECQSTWPGYAFDQWVRDNGQGFNETAVVQSVLAGLGKDQHSPAGIAWMRGRIERFFRTIATKLLSFFLGQARSKVKERSEIDDQAFAMVTNAELMGIIIRWVVDYYHHEVHSALGMTPFQAWYLLCAEAPPYPPHGPAKLADLFGVVETRVLDERGVVVANSQFQSVKLQAIRRAIGHGTKVKVKIDYENLGQILVRIPDRVLKTRPDIGAEPWLSVPGPKELSGISLRHLELVDDELAMRFGYDSATTEKHRDEARRAISTFARDAAKARLSEVAVDLEYIEKRKGKSFHTALHFGDDEFRARQLEELLRPIKLKPGVKSATAPTPTASAVPIKFKD